MPRYISAQDIYDYEVYNLTSTDINTATVEIFIDDAESLVDGKASKLYSVPFTATGIPHLVKKISRDLAGYYCLDYLYSQQQLNVNDWVINKYNEALDLLNDISNDDIRLVASLSTGSVGAIATNRARNLAGTYTDIPSIINMDNEFDWSVSDSLLDDIDARRDAAE